MKFVRTYNQNINNLKIIKKVGLKKKKKIKLINLYYYLVSLMKGNSNNEIFNNLLNNARLGTLEKAVNNYILLAK